MKKYFLLLFLLPCGLLQAQFTTFLYPSRNIFYNVENLFDTINDPDINDEEFLPSSKNKWNTEKYQTKLSHIAKAIAAMTDTIRPMVVGLAEVENIKVLEDLVEQPEIKKFKFRIVHRDSPDERGIDVAFLWNPLALRIDFDSYLKVEFPFDTADRTRDIFYMKTYIREGEPVWFFVNHWPSRSEGKEQTEAKRLYAAKVLKEKIENIYMGEPFAAVVVMGDFNDNPGDSSLMTLSAKSNSKAEPLVNLMKPMQESNQFTLRYMESSDVFDQFIVSKNLLSSSNAYYIRNGQAHIFSPDWLLYNHEKYGLIPNRTFANGKWVKGYSDHLPVYLDILFNLK